MKLYVSVPAREPGLRLRNHRGSTDGVVLMNYDEHDPSAGRAGSGGLAGLVHQESGDRQEEDSAGQADLRHRQLRLRLGAEAEEGKPAAGVKNTNVTVQEAWLAARDSDDDIDFDYDSLNPHFSYLDEQQSAARRLVPRWQ